MFDVGEVGFWAGGSFQKNPFVVFVQLVGVCSYSNYACIMVGHT